MEYIEGRLSKDGVYRRASFGLKRIFVASKDMILPQRCKIVSAKKHPYKNFIFGPNTRYLDMQLQSIWHFVRGGEACKGPL